MTYERGSVVVASDPFGRTPRRPYLILSDDRHPFAGEQYIAAGISTRAYDASIPLAGRFREGGLTRDSFVSPWAVVSLRAEDIERAVAQVSASVLQTTARRVAHFVGASPADDAVT
jgi:mRNA-degrading endonuclease toxin of MazEF toxin-antitoxin module